MAPKIHSRGSQDQIGPGVLYPDDMPSDDMLQIGEIIQRFERKGLTLAGMKLIRPDIDRARRYLSLHVACSAQCVVPSSMC